MLVTSRHRRVLLSAIIGLTMMSLCSSELSAQATGNLTYDQAMSIYTKLSAQQIGMPNALNYPFIFADPKSSLQTSNLGGMPQQRPTAYLGLMSLTNSDAVLANLDTIIQRTMINETMSSFDPVYGMRFKPTPDAQLISTKPSNLTSTTPEILTLPPVELKTQLPQVEALAINGGLTKAGAGTLTLTTSNTSTGSTTVCGGTLTVNNGGVLDTGSIIGAGSKLNITPITGGILTLGTGTLNISGGLSNDLSLGSGSVIDTTGRPITITPVQPVTITQGTLDGAGVINPVTVSDGTSGVIINSGNVSLNIGSLTFNGVGTMNLNTTSQPVLVVTNSTTGGNAVTVNSSAPSWDAGTYNLMSYNGGIVTAKLVNQAAGTGTFNFNGGTLKANANNATFTTDLNGSFVFSGGAMIDDSGYPITIGQPLTVPTGNTGSAGSLTLSNSGYIETPVVSITNDSLGTIGSGAIAVANLDTSGNLSGITITNPGTAYTTTPTFAIMGGGLTKTGAGTLILTGGNTYTGNTTVLNGALDTLAINSPTGSVSIAAGANSLNAQSITANTLTIGAGAKVTIKPLNNGPLHSSTSLTALSSGPLTAGSITAVPEPGTIVMLLMAALGFAVSAWRNRR
jgi:autotransporter-associated beta strand protein